MAAWATGSSRGQGEGRHPFGGLSPAETYHRVRLQPQPHLFIFAFGIRFMIDAFQALIDDGHTYDRFYCFHLFNLLFVVCVKAATEAGSCKRAFCTVTRTTT